MIAKPAEQTTPDRAIVAVKLLHEAGVPEDVLQFLPGDGATVGAALTRDPRVAGVVFTGSTETAWAINRALAARNAATGDPDRRNRRPERADRRFLGPARATGQGRR